MDSRIYIQLDRIEAKLAEVDVRLAKYNSELEFHISRTNQLEDAFIAFHTEFKPVQEQVQQAQGMAKLVGWILAAAGTIGGIAWWKK